jgi:formin-binding protein 1
MDFVTVATEAQDIQLSHQDILKDRLAIVNAALVEVQPDKDQALFVDSNIRPFSIPEDWIFEPCSSHYDTVCLTDLSSGHSIEKHA